MQNVFAQENTQEAEEQYNVNIIPEINIQLDEVLFDEESRTLTAVTYIENTTNDVLENLGYSLNLMMGDKLNDNGYIFEYTKFVITGEGKVNSIAPHDKIKANLTMQIPENIESANYFLRVNVFDKNLSINNGTYTNYPFYLNGTGTRLADVKVFFYSDAYDMLFNPMVGMSVSPDNITKIVIPLDENEQIQKMINDGEQIDANVTINRTIKDNGIVKQFKTTLNKETILDKEMLTFDLLADNEELKQGGSFGITAELLNHDEEIFKLNARWLIEFGQMMGKIYEVNTSKKLYKEGESIDVIVTTTLINAKDKKGIVELILRGENGFEQKVTKDIVFKKKWCR